MREAILQGGARAYYALMSPGERYQIDERRRYPEERPSVDGITTFESHDPAGFRLFDDGTWRMSYHVPDDASLTIFGIKHYLDLPG